MPGVTETLTIPDFSGCRVLVAGDVMLDEYWFGDSGRISPEAPVPVVRVTGTEERPGGAANVALNLASLATGVRLVGAVGDDERGRRLETLLSARGVGCDFEKAAALPTIHKLRVLARNQQLIRLDAEEPMASQAEAVSSRAARALEEADLLVCSDYAKGALGAVEGLIEQARSRAVPVLVDPKGTDFSRYRGATLLTPNFAEFQAVVGPVPDNDALVTLARELVRGLQLKALLVTRGEQGMTLVPGEGDAIHLPAESREVFDVTGAGDTVIAVFAAAMAAEQPLAGAARLANLAAGLVVRRIGAATVTPMELKLALHRRGAGGGRGILSAAEAQSAVAEAQGRGERVVMTNGCFDLLHAGHVGYLEDAKALGDHLIVAVNDDRSVARLKGSGRPLTPLADRMAVLAGLAAVDWVVPFEEDTPANLIADVAPDVLVKGGDYRPEEIAGAEHVTARGGEVRVLRFRPGRSTSALVDAIRRRD